MPKVGDTVCYRPWGYRAEDEPWHAKVAKVFGANVNLAILSGTGAWLAEGPVPFDPTGTQAGHWSWPRG